MEALSCPVCETTIQPSDISPSRHINRLLLSLKLCCTKGCGKTFGLDDIGEKSHEMSCENIKLKDIINMPTTSKLPKIAQQAVASIIKHKMANSEMPNKAIAISS